MKDPRILSVRMSLNEAINELQDMAVVHPAERPALESFARDIAALRDRCGAGLFSPIPTDPMGREDFLDHVLERKTA